jgi:hypothetical protein
VVTMGAGLAAIADEGAGAGISGAEPKGVDKLGVGAMVGATGWLWSCGPEPGSEGRRGKEGTGGSVACGAARPGASSLKFGNSTTVELAGGVTGESVGSATCRTGGMEGAAGNAGVLAGANNDGELVEVTIESKIDGVAARDSLGVWLSDNFESESKPVTTETSAAAEVVRTDCLKMGISGD